MNIAAQADPNPRMSPLMNGDSIVAIEIKKVMRVSLNGAEQRRLNMYLL